VLHALVGRDPVVPERGQHHPEQGHEEEGGQEVEHASLAGNAGEGVRHAAGDVEGRRVHGTAAL
jgi:hypothetical protein